MKNKKIKKILIIIAILLAIIVITFIVGFIVFMNDVKNEQKEDEEQVSILDSEVENINELMETETTIDDESLEIKTTGDYAVVESTIKEHMKEWQEIANECSMLLEGKGLEDVLTIEDIQQNDENFSLSKQKIVTQRERIQTDYQKYEEFFDIEKTWGKIEDKDIPDYYKELYKSYFQNNVTLEEQKSKVENQKQKLLEELDILDKIADFLSNTRNDWRIENNTVTFNTQENYNQYTSLIDELEKVRESMKDL